MKINKKTIFINIIFGTVFILCIILSFFKLFSFISFIAFIIYMIYIAFKYQEFVIKYLAFLFIAGMAIIGTTIIELGKSFYLKELQCFSAYTGSLPLLILVYWLFIFTLYIVDYKCNFNIKKINFNNSKQFRKFINLISLVVFVLFALLFSNVVSHSALFLGMDRFIYASKYGVNGIWRIITNEAPLLIIFPILSVIYGSKLIGISTILLYILYFLWTGNKFGPFFTLLCIFLLVYYKDILKKGKKYIKKIILISGIGFCFLLIYTVFFAVSTSPYESVSYIMQRAAQQGQLWWKTYEQCDSVHTGDFLDEIKSIGNGKEAISDNIGSSNGIYKIMYYCAPKSLVDYKLSTGSLYTEAGFALMYYYFGILGVIFFAVFCGIIFSLTINAFIKALNKKDYIKALILIRFFILERTFISMMIYNDFYDLLSILSFIYLLVMARKKFQISNKGLMIIRD